MGDPSHRRHSRLLPVGPRIPKPGGFSTRRSALAAGLIGLSLLAGCSLPVMPMVKYIPVQAAETPPTATPFSPPETIQDPPPAATLPPKIGEVRATVWPADPQAPVLLYHHFVPDTAAADDTHIRYAEFRKELQALYDNGYSLISLGQWLSGNMQFIPGRRPVILTIDDLFYADQVFIQPDGTPAPNTGIGILWQFYQAHPDFGFAVAMFANLGDKRFPTGSAGSAPGAGWEDSLARTIAWCIDHGAIPYNHFLLHPFLDRLTADQITGQARDNDLRLQALLTRAGRPELFDQVENILALPYGHWPVSQDGIQAVLGYTSQQGEPVLGIVEVGGIYAGHYLQPVYSPSFDRNHLPRMVGSSLAMGYLSRFRDRFPVAREVRLGLLDLNRLGTPGEKAAALETVCRSTACPAGVYALLGSLFRVDNGTASLLWAPNP